MNNNRTCCLMASSLYLTVWLTGCTAEESSIRSGSPHSDVMHSGHASHSWKLKSMDGALYRRLWDEERGCWLTDWLPV